MTYNTWMSETKRGVFTARSQSLKAVDAAFEQLDRVKTPQCEIQLADKLKLWLDSKGASWKQSTRNSTKIQGKGTVERLLEDLSKSPLIRTMLSGYIVHTAPAALKSKIIVFSGHGAWALNKDAYTKLPAKCSIKFYTMNMRTLSDGLGGEIDRGIVTGYKPDQEGGPFSSIPDMRLYPPAGLNIKEPDLATWAVVNLPGAVPNSSKNLQIKINSKYGGGASLSVMFDLLKPAIDSASSVIFLWAACRAIGLSRTGGKLLGVNTMQR